LISNFLVLNHATYFLYFIYVIFFWSFFIQLFIEFHKFHISKPNWKIYDLNLLKKFKIKLKTITASKLTKVNDERQNEHLKGKMAETYFKQTLMNSILNDK